MDLETVYNMAASAARGADHMCGHGGGSEPVSYRLLGGYPFHINQYNRLLKLAAELDPAVTKYVEPIDVSKVPDPRGLTSGIWGIYAEQAAVALNSLASYLQSKLGKKQQEYEQIIDLIKANLRRAIFKDPGHEREVQERLEIIFNARNLDFLREKVTIPYSNKYYIPDFTFDRIGLAVEVKLCKDKDREKVIIDEINADIPAYATKYERSLFVVYDLGVIRDEERFRSDIEKNHGAHVLIVKK
jgi:REase_DpnII-MboI